MSQPLTKTELNDPVTRHLRRDFVQLRADLSVSEALAAARDQPPESPVVYFYAVDDTGRLLGVVPTRVLLFADPNKKIEDVMIRRVIAVPHSATVLDACEFFVLHRLLAFPVIDEDRHVLGVVDAELYTDELTVERREETHDLFQLIGVHLTEAQKASSVAAFWERFPWLLCNIAGGILAAVLTGFFEGLLAKVVTLALFIPVVLALSESVAIQSVSLALETLHGQQPSWRALLRRLWREGTTGVMLGLACGVAVAGVALVWRGEWRVALCLTGGIGGGVALAALVGMAIPYTLRLWKLDPRIASGPIALASADMMTLLIYFNLAVLLLG